MSNYNILLTACAKFNKMQLTKQTEFFYLLAYAYIQRKDFIYPLERELSFIEIIKMPEYIQNMFLNFVK